MRPLIPEEVNLKIDNLVGKFFEANRIMDRGCSLLDTEFGMNKTAGILHGKLSHLFPLIADKLSDYQSKRSNLTIYPPTPLGAKSYENPLSFFEDVLNFMLSIESDVYETCESAKDSNDYMTAIFLDNFMLSLIPITHQLLLLTDKSEKYKEDYQSFDHRIKDWIVL